MSEDDYSYEHLKKFKYIDCIQKETTRIYGPANGLFLREPAEDLFLKDIPIKKGTLVSIRFTGSHYDEKYFKDPFKFQPERWENDPVLPPYVVGGFGGGARTCIGKHLALLESKIALIKFMKRYKKIVLPAEKIKMRIKLAYSPENFKVKL